MDGLGGGKMKDWVDVEFKSCYLSIHLKKYFHNNIWCLNLPWSSREPIKPLCQTTDWLNYIVTEQSIAFDDCHFIQLSEIVFQSAEVHSKTVPYNVSPLLRICEQIAPIVQIHCCLCLLLITSYIFLTLKSLSGFRGYNPLWQTFIVKCLWFYFSLTSHIEGKRKVQSFQIS